MARIRVALIEDNPEFLEEVSALLADAPTLEVVGRYPTGEEAIKGLEVSHPDIALIDLELPGMSRVEVIHHLMEQGEPPECVALTVFDDDEHLFAALQAGAVGYIVKSEISLPELVRLLQNVKNGGAPMSLGIARRILQEFRQTPRLSGRSEVQELTSREREILEYRVKGFTTKKVAEHLHISYETVRLHQKHIYEKLHVHSMGEAVAVFRREK